MITKKLIKSLPQKPGVYLFKDKIGHVLYVGKSVDIKSRVRSHLLATGEKTRRMVKLATNLETIVVEGELEALLLEAKLIKKHLPHYNSASKDDKHPLYIKITTKETFPKVSTARREDDSKAIYFGPFPASSTVKYVLRKLRRIFPYCAQKSIGKRPCLYSHLNLCGPCPAEIVKQDVGKQQVLKKKYRQNIKKLTMVLSGKSKQVKKLLDRQMREAAERQDYETAALLRDQLKKLEYVTADYKKAGDYLKNPNLLGDLREKEIDTLYHQITPYMKIKLPRRIEGFDVSHIGGREATCSLVTFVDGEPEKSLYRRFKIRTKKTRDDFAMLHEAVSRSLKHLSDWGKPDLILIDGGKGQVSACLSALSASGHDIPLIGLAKRHEEIIIPVEKTDLGYQYKVLTLGEDNPATQLLQRIRDEAHRFARAYHFQLRMRDLTNQGRSAHT